MTVYHQVKHQNKEIEGLTNSLRVLIENQSPAQVETMCSLFFTYSKKVDSYFKTIETCVYNEMLSHTDLRINKHASRFMASSCGIMRLLSQYRKRWCNNKKASIDNYIRFTQESEDILKLITQRINDEAVYLHPIIKEISKKQEPICA